MSSANAETLHIDEARNWIVQRLAELLGAGVYQVRFRVTHPDGKNSEAWLYRHQNSQWVKTEWIVTEPALVIAVQDVAQMLGSHPPTEDWHSRRRESVDFLDTDLTFHKEAVARQRGSQLESWLRGSLFQGPHLIPDSRRLGHHEGSAGNS